MKNLPKQPSLEHLRGQAKSLLRTLQASEPALRLSEAQHRLAREYGFDSWPKLVEHVHLVSLKRSESITTVENGIRQGREGRRAIRLLLMDPSLARASAACSLVALDLQKIRRIAAGDVALPIGALNAPAIAYAAFSPLAPAKPSEYAEAIRLLVEAGADPNTRYIHPDFPDSPLPVLYSAAAVNRNLASARILLEAGADPNDNESLYHCAENGNHEALKLVIEFGAVVGNSNALLRMLDFEDPEGLEIMLAANPDLSHPNALIHAMRRGRSDAIICRLLMAGADPDSRDHLGFSARQIAFEQSRDIPELTDGFEPSEADRLLAACWRGDAAEAANFKSAYAGLSAFRRKGFTDACWAGRADTIDAFVAGGFELTVRDDSKATPLHCACFAGSSATVEALLRHNPPMDDANDMYHAIPIQYAMHASENSGDAQRDWEGCVRLLIAAGSPPPSRVFGSEPIRQRLRETWPDLSEDTDD